MTTNTELYLGDCLEFLPTMTAGSIDAVITDPPFGTGTAEWDKEPSSQVWTELQRICPNGPICIIGYAQQLVRWSRFFELKLIGEIIWHKYNEVKVSPGLTRAHQDIFIFGRAATQIHAERVREPYAAEHLARWHGGRAGFDETQKRLRSNMLKRGELKRSPQGRRCSDVWSIPAPGAGFNAHLRLHPNQKPDELMRRLIVLLTNEGNTVLDCYMGSGTTGVAACYLQRHFVGCELVPEYFTISKQRIAAAEMQLHLPFPPNQRIQPT